MSEQEVLEAAKKLKEAQVLYLATRAAFDDAEKHRGEADRAFCFASKQLSDARTNLLDVICGTREK